MRAFFGIAVVSVLFALGHFVLTSVDSAEFISSSFRAVFSVLAGAAKAYSQYFEIAPLLLGVSALFYKAKLMSEFGETYYAELPKLKEGIARFQRAEARVGWACFVALLTSFCAAMGLFMVDGLLGRTPANIIACFVAGISPWLISAPSGALKVLNDLLLSLLVSKEKLHTAENLCRSAIGPSKLLSIYQMQRTLEYRLSKLMEQADVERKKAHQPASIDGT